MVHPHSLPSILVQQNVIRGTTAWKQETVSSVTSITGIIVLLGVGPPPPSPPPVDCSFTDKKITVYIPGSSISFFYSSVWQSRQNSAVSSLEDFFEGGGVKSAPSENSHPGSENTVNTAWQLEAFVSLAHRGCVCLHVCVSLCFKFLFAYSFLSQ